MTVGLFLLLLRMRIFICITIKIALFFARIYIFSGPVLGMMFVFINAIQSTGAAMPAAAQPITDYLAASLAIVLLIFTYRKYFPKEVKAD